jgi:putative Mg2+ transporter-C (MgtC) family protein
MTGWDSVLDALARLGAATMLGGVIGLEREFRDRAAGLRTHMMVAMGSALFVAAAQTAIPGTGEDVSRAIQGIAAGIGFVGAGTILKLTDQGEVKGLTTASSIWLTAAIGTAAGLGLYPIAVVGTVLALLILALMYPLERVIPRRKDHND